MPQPDDTPDVELPKPPEEEAPADEQRRAGRFKRFVARQIRRGADAIDRRRATRAARG